MRIGRRRRRSTQAPAGRLNRMNGRNSIVPSRATSNGEAPRSVTATSGRARRLICVPNWLIVSAIHSRTKSGLRRTEGVAGAGAGARRRARSSR